MASNYYDKTKRLQVAMDAHPVQGRTKRGGSVVNRGNSAVALTPGARLSHHGAEAVLVQRHRRARTPMDVGEGPGY